MLSINHSPAEDHNSKKKYMIHAQNIQYIYIYIYIYRMYQIKQTIIKCDKFRSNIKKNNTIRIRFYRFYLR